MTDEQQVALRSLLKDRTLWRLVDGYKDGAVRLERVGSQDFPIPLERYAIAPDGTTNSEAVNLD